MGSTFLAPLLILRAHLARALAPSGAKMSPITLFWVPFWSCFCVCFVSLGGSFRQQNQSKMTGICIVKWSGNPAPARNPRARSGSANSQKSPKMSAEPCKENGAPDHFCSFPPFLQFLLISAHFHTTASCCVTPPGMARAPTSKNFPLDAYWISIGVY